MRISDWSSDVCSSDLASSGVINATLYRYPILQRSDRYAMLSGKLTVNAQLPAISIIGDVKADAGWFNLDVLGSVPSIDGDVVVIRPGEENTVQVPSRITQIGRASCRESGGQSV